MEARRRAFHFVIPNRLPLALRNPCWLSRALLRVCIVPSLQCLLEPAREFIRDLCPVVLDVVVDRNSSRQNRSVRNDERIVPALLRGERMFRGRGEALLYCERPRHECAEVVKLADTPS